MHRRHFLASFVILLNVSVLRYPRCLRPALGNHNRHPGRFGLLCPKETSPEAKGGPRRLSDGADNPNNPAPSPPQSLQSLNEQLSNASLKSSSRTPIPILLAMNKKPTATELRALTGLGR